MEFNVLDPYFKEEFIINHTDFLKNTNHIWLSKSDFAFFVWNDKTGEVTHFSNLQKAEKKFETLTKKERDK